MRYGDRTHTCARARYTGARHKSVRHTGACQRGVRCALGRALRLGACAAPWGVCCAGPMAHMELREQRRAVGRPVERRVRRVRRVHMRGLGRIGANPASVGVGAVVVVARALGWMLLLSIVRLLRVRLLRVRLLPVWLLGDAQHGVQVAQQRLQLVRVVVSLLRAHDGLVRLGLELAECERLELVA